MQQSFVSCYRTKMRIRNFFTGETFHTWPRISGWEIGFTSLLLVWYDDSAKICWMNWRRESVAQWLIFKVHAFKEKLELWYVKVKNKNFAFFPILNSFIEDLDPDPNLMTLVLFILEHLHTLRKNFKKCIPKNINYARVKILFTANVANFNAGFLSGFQEQLINFKSDSLIKLSFGKLLVPKFWCQAPNQFPIMYKETLKITIPFPCSALCEMGFSIPAFMKNKYRNHLNA